MSPSAPSSDERARLMAAAERVLERSGWWGFKVDRVLREAGLSTRSFYRHFQSKEDLVAGLLEDTLLKIADAVADAVAPTLPPAARVRLYVDSLIGWAFEPDFAKPALMLANNWRELLPVQPELITRCLEAFIAPLIAALEAGRDDGTLTSLDPEADAKSVFLLVSGVLFDLPRREGETSREDIEATVVPFMWRALGIPALID
jgi:AcrR family transcriptional regulator